MSIDAIIDDVTYNDDGTANLELVARDPKYASAGQKSLTVLNPPAGELLNAAVGTKIWGNSSSILVGEKLWAKRESYISIRLVSLILCLMCPSLAVADCQSGSCSVADLIAAETVATVGHQPPVAVTVRVYQVQPQHCRRIRRVARCRR